MACGFGLGIELGSELCQCLFGIGENGDFGTVRAGQRFRIDINANEVFAYDKIRIPKIGCWKFKLSGKAAEVFVSVMKNCESLVSCPELVSYPASLWVSCPVWAWVPLTHYRNYHSR